MRLSKEKILFSIVLISIVIIFCSILTVSAESTKYFYDGRWHEYNADPTFLKINGDTVNTDVPPIIFEDRSVVPARAVFEKLGAKVSWDGTQSLVGIVLNNTDIKLKINDKYAVVNGNACEMDIPAKIINDRTMIPTRFIGETLGFNVGWIGEQRLITIDSEEKQNTQDNYVNNISYTKNNENIRIKIMCESKISEYNSFKLDNHPRLVIDIMDAILKYDKEEIDINNNTVYGLRTSQYEINPNTTRIVIDMKSWPKYNISKSDNGKELYIDFNVKESKVNNISFEDYSNKDILDIEMDIIKKPNIFRLTNPNRIVMDFPGSILNLTEKKDVVNSDLVKTIRYGQFDENTTRIVLDVKGQPLFEVKEYDDKIRVEIEESTIRNLTYSNNKDPQIIIESTAVLDNYNQKLIDGNTYIVSVDRSKADFGQGRLYINDGYFNYIDVVRNTDNNTTDFIFKSVNPHKYDVKKLGRNTIITAIRGNMVISDDSYTDIDIPSAVKKKTVVIDAGHGGKDPGAVWGTLKEKDINLDIALKLKELLKEKGIDVHLTRETDVFIELEERADIANYLNADLFVSIHNNAMSEPDYDGSMTLYYSDRKLSRFKLSSRDVSAILQKEMVSHLGTTDRGLRQRPRLVVLRETKMPAALVEIAFITNKTDRNNLSKDEFRTRAAESIYVGIIKALSKL